MAKEQTETYTLAEEIGNNHKRVEEVAESGEHVKRRALMTSMATQETQHFLKGIFTNTGCDFSFSFFFCNLRTVNL